MAWPLAIGALALDPLSFQAMTRRLRGSPTYGEILRLAVLVAVGLLLLRPRLLFSGTPIWVWLRASADACETFWWWPWRWREFLIGLPAFMQALFLVGRQYEEEIPAVGRPSFGDPRPWLWLGLLFPIGVIASLGRPGLDAYMVLGHTAIVLVVGMFLGGALLAVRCAWGRTKGPKAVQDY
jgi:hypothetical protein